MELVTLDAQFQPVRLVENYDSLIWSERYSTAGDFELTSFNVSEALKYMPLESYVGLRESTVPMIVEAHKISKPKNQPASISITGRSFESVLERRGSARSMPATGTRPVWTVSVTKQSDAAYMAMREILGDSARSIGGAVALTAVSPSASPLDVIPQINTPIPVDYANASAAAWSSATAYVVGNQVTYLGSVWKAVAANTNVAPTTSTPQWVSLGTPVSTEIKPGNLYGVMLELIDASHHGIRSVRPLPDIGKTTVDVEIYNGANLTGTGPTGDPNNVVVFDARFDQIDSATYLFTYQGSTNIAYVYGLGAAGTDLNTVVRKNTAGAEVSGLDRRVIVIDEQTDSNLSTDAVRTSRGLVELYKNNAIAIFDGETSEQVGKLFNKPISQGGYGLGDIVRLNGEYGMSRNVRVVEFIRTSDSTGTKAYPAFQVVDE